MANIDNFTFTQILRMRGYENTGGIDVYGSEITDLTIGSSEESVPITGAGGATLKNLKRNKQVTVSGTSGFFSTGLLAAQLGTEVTHNEKNSVRWSEILTVGADKSVTLSYKAIGVAGQEITNLRQKVGSIVLGKKFSQVTATPATGEFKYDAATKKITFFSNDFSQGDQVYVDYFRSVLTSRILNNANNYAKTLRMEIDAVATDVCDEEYFAQFIFNRADLNGTFDIALGNDPASQSFEFSALKDACSGFGDLFEILIFEHDADDVA